MGRIEDALRRSESGYKPVSSVVADREVFVSPWSVSEAPEQRPVEASQAAALDLLPNPDDVLLRAPRAYRSDLLTLSTGADPALSGQFRRMAATLYNAQDQANLKVVMVTSAVPGEGKTLTTMNLSLILSQSFRCRVLLIDADLRRPSIHRAWGVDGDRGLTDALNPANEHELAVRRLSETLTLLPAGRPDPDPTGGLTSGRMRRILEEARAGFDWVILDSPPIAAVDDATLLGSMVDAVLFVVRARKTHSTTVRRAIESIGPSRIFGVVLNGAEAGDAPGYGYYEYGYGATTD